MSWIKSNAVGKMRDKLIYFIWLIVSVAFILICLEVTVRITSNINFLGNSKNLIEPRLYGDSFGNAKNIRATSFGVDIFTDKYGFRVDKEYLTLEPAKYKETVVVMGDSVGFGAGVEFTETFAGLLSADKPSLLVHNSSVIGYNVNDYKNFAQEFLSYFNDSINHAFLIYCLNDLIPISAANINESVSINKDTATLTSLNSDIDLVTKLKKINFINSMNSFLRSYSKLYLLIKGIFTDPQLRYWENDLVIYKDLNVSESYKALEPLSYVNDFLKKKSIPLTVIIMPYEYQVRFDNVDTNLPQNILRNYFENQNISYIDALPSFRNGNMRSSELFLPYDPMHLSAQGHKLLYTIIANQLE